MTDRAEKLYEKMRQSSANWSPDDLIKLYIGYGFTVRNGARHDIISHPQFPILRAAIPRHATDLANGYIAHAVKLIEQLKQLLDQ